MSSRTFLHISTTNSVINGGGGTANTAFPERRAPIPQVGNARATQVQATFWIETIAGTGGHPASFNSDVHATGDARLQPESTGLT